MRKARRQNDVISEQDYTLFMASRSTSPINDCPADSDLDFGSEVLMGVGYSPYEKSDFTRGEGVATSWYSDVIGWE